MKKRIGTHTIVVTVPFWRRVALLFLGRVVVTVGIESSVYDPKLRFNGARAILVPRRLKNVDAIGRPQFPQIEADWPSKADELRKETAA